MDDERGTATAAVTSADPPSVDTDLLVFPVFEDEGFECLPGLDEATGGEVSRAFGRREVKGKAFEFFITPVVGRGWRARRVGLVGGGRRPEYDADRARRVASAVAIAARDRRVTRLALVHRGTARPDTSEPDASGLEAWVQAITEGLTLGEFVSGHHKTSERPERSVAQVEVVVPGAPLASLRRLVDATARGQVLGACTNLARELTNEPGGLLTPRALAARAADLVTSAGVTVEILDEHAMSSHGMGLLLGVAQGSHERPRLLVLRHEPPGAPASPVLGLVGKGITFDAGGISLKPPAGMDRMKDDMAGGAAVICAMRAIGLLRAPIRVIGVVPCAENMPGGGAIRPGDVLKAASGRTVEIIDTDAEGRLVLADALWYARQLGVTHLVDIATLTGACQVALGKIACGLMGRSDAWVEHVRTAANRAGDRSWVLPLFEEYREQLRSEIADLANVGGKPAGAITAAMFLREFTGDLPWAHLDIAGTAWVDEAKPYAPKGPSGAGVRALAELAFTSF